MRPVLMLALVLLLFAAPTQPQQELKLPKDGNGLLEYCGPVVASFDSPSQTYSGESHGIQMMKQGWCAGHLQTMHEMIVFWQIQVLKTVSFQSGDLNPSAESLKELMSKMPDART